MHTQSMQRARELGIPLGPHPGGSYAAAASSGSAAADAQRTPAPALLGTRSLLQAGSSGEAARNAGAVATLPIRIWVEYQGVNALSASERTKLVETVNITLGVLHKYLRVGGWAGGRLGPWRQRRAAATWSLDGGCWHAQLVAWHNPDVACASAVACNPRLAAVWLAGQAPALRPPAGAGHLHSVGLGRLLQQVRQLAAPGWGSAPRC
jgi:hypothetical protein